MTELALRREIRVVDALPMPGTGELDYVAAEDRAAAAASTTPGDDVG